MRSHRAPPDRDPLRIAYLTYRGKPHVGGQGVYTRHLTKALADLGHDVEVFGGQPYPVLDERIPLHKLPSLDIFNDHYPGRLPGVLGAQDARTTCVEVLQFTARARSREPLAFSVRAYHDAEAADRASSISCTTTSASATASSQIEKMIPTIVTLHHPITKDRAARDEHTRRRGASARSIGRWYNFVKMQGRVASRMPRIVVVSENSIKDIHADMGVSLDRMRLVPVGVDPELFRPMPHVARLPGRLITTASADVALKGLRVPAGGDGQAAHRARRRRLTIIGKPRAGARATT